MKKKSQNPYGGSSPIAINIPAIIKFYHLIISKGYLKFKTISEERFSILDVMAKNYRNYYFKKNQKSTMALMCQTANKLVAAPPGESSGFDNYEEMLYFYIKVIDPELKMLEIYDQGVKEQDIKEILMNYFGIYDINLIKFEKHLNAHLNLLDTFDNAFQAKK